MSAAQPSDDGAPAREPVARSTRDMSQLRTRRAEARRRRRLARVDLGLGLLGAIALLIFTPGLAIASLLALVVLALCVLSLVVERRRSRRR